MDKKFAPGSYGCHEALHTTSVIMDLVERSLLVHPSIRDHPRWSKLADAAHQALFDLYQSIGAEHLEADVPVAHPRRKRRT